MAEIGNKEDDRNSIMEAVVRNPLAAIQLVAVILGGAGVYYRLSSDITTVQSDVLHDRVDLDQRSARRQRDVDDLNKKQEDIQARSVAHYNELQTKLELNGDKMSVVKEALTTQIGAVNSKVDKLGTDIEWLIRRLDNSNTSGQDNNNNAGPAPVPHGIYGRSKTDSH